MSNQILLIEDEQNIIAAISFILSRAGWAVKTHSNGTDAIEAVRRHAPTVVILDVMLPGKTGYEILRDLRADAELRDIPVLMLTAKGQQADRELAEMTGADCFMTKPFSNAEMLETVNQLAKQ